MMNPERMVYEIAVWLKEQMDLANARGYVVGLSGGVDSAVAAALAVKGVGAEKVFGVLMPCQSHADDHRHASNFAKEFYIRFITVPLDGVYQAYMETLYGLPLMSGIETSKANLKARLRMVTLYWYANYMNYLVLGTGNRSEIEMGYFTKYGDGGVDVLPLRRLYKDQVYRLARVLDVPQEVIDRPPSAGLWPGQTDEEEMGVTYEDIECFLSGAGDANTPEQNIKMGLMQKRSEHKRRMPPIWTGL